MVKRLVCPILNCDYEPRAHRNRDKPETAKDRLYAHIFLAHRKEEIINALLLAMSLVSPLDPIEDIEVYT